MFIVLFYSPNGLLVHYVPAISPAKHAKLFTTRFTTGTILGNLNKQFTQRTLSSFKKLCTEAWLWCGRCISFGPAKKSKVKTDGIEVERFKLIKFAPEVRVKQFTMAAGIMCKSMLGHLELALALQSPAMPHASFMTCWFSKMQNLHKSSCSYAKRCCWGISSYL